MQKKSTMAGLNKYRKAGFFFVILFWGGQICLAQKSHELLNSKTVFLEVGGNGLLYSLNYDQVFYHNKKKALTWRLGVSALSGKGTGFGPSLFLIGEVNYLYGRIPHFLEAGAGLTYWQAFQISNDINWVFIPRIGYRYQSPAGGLFFRVAFTPNLALKTNTDDIFRLWAGISLGYTFKPKQGNKQRKKSLSDTWGNP